MNQQQPLHQPAAVGQQPSVITTTNTHNYNTNQLSAFLRDKSYVFEFLLVFFPIFNWDYFRYWENAIASYNGTDPLQMWYEYIGWYEQNAALDTENQLEAILGKCLSMYEYSDHFKQDQRMVKLWMKYVSYTKYCFFHVHLMRINFSNVFFLWSLFWDIVNVSPYVFTLRIMSSFKLVRI